MVIFAPGFSVTETLSLPKGELVTLVDVVDLDSLDIIVLKQTPSVGDGIKVPSKCNYCPCVIFFLAYWETIWPKYGPRTKGEFTKLYSDLSNSERTNLIKEKNWRVSVVGFVPRGGCDLVGLGHRGFRLLVRDQRGLRPVDLGHRGVRLVQFWCGQWLVSCGMAGGGL